MRIALFIAALTILCVLIVSGALVLKNYQEKKSESTARVQEATVPSSPPLSAPNLQPPSDWKIYSNDKFGFQVMYPPKAKFNEFNGYFSQPSLIGQVAMYVDQKSPPDNTSVIISVWKNLGVQVNDLVSYDKWCKKLKPELQGQQQCQYDNLQPYQFQHYPAFMATGGKDNAAVTVYYVPIKSYIYEIEEGIAMDTPTSTTSATILSSIKFTP